MALRREFPSRGKAVFIVTTVTFILATIFVASRLISRFFILRHKTGDDWLMIVAWVIAFGLSFAIDYGAFRGLGRHDADIPQEWLPALRQSEYAFTILYNPALMATKTSILVFYLRMSKNTQKFLRRASYATLALVNVEGVVLTFINAFQCNPVAAAYTPSIPGKCMSIVTIYLCSAPVNLVANLAILVLPIPLLTGMRLPQRQKTVLVFTFSLGIFVTIVDVVRIYYLQKAADTQAADAKAKIQASVRLGTGLDFAWNASISLMWSAVEVNVGIICACIPTLKPLIRRILPSMITDITHSRSDKSASTEARIRTNLSQQDSSHSAMMPAQPSAAQVQRDQDQQIDMLDFLTTPETNAATLEERMARSAAVNGRRNINRTGNLRASGTQTTESTSNTIYFGLIEMKRPKSMLKIRGMESFKYCTAVTILFFLWGFSYGLLNTLNGQISKVAMETPTQRLGLSSAYFTGYLIGPLTVGQWVLRHYGFKATFIYGLCIYGIGTLMFWPSAVQKSWPGFLLCQFVVGYGLSILETAANPFIALCGPAQYAEYRLLLSQGVQATASVLSQLLAQKVLFDNLSQDVLLDVQWTYLAVALVCVILALFFYYMPLPEATDTDLQKLAENLSIYPSQTIFSDKLPLIYTTAFLAIFCQFLYVAAQESNAVWFEPLFETLSPISSFTISLQNYTLVAQTLFAASRFIFAALCLVIRPRILLLTAFLLGILFLILAHTLDLSANGMAGPILMWYFFEGPIFPLVFAIGIRGMGRWTKWTAAILIASVSGGAVFPFVVWAVTNSHSVQYSYCVIIAIMAFGTLFPIYLNAVPAARHQVDPAIASSLGNRPIEEDLEATGGKVRRMSKRFVSIFGSRRASSVSAGSESPQFEHREDDSELEREVK
ncbi:major facilitator superfamily domain-containing protein [Bisporella sp. PMI_857]|nr:major facilitator superfamily domain-containing protein [Bisporella sp. PMI_857]